jgi:UDP-2,3-diacylglucosamine pyrophosphatase LpxH
MAVIYVHGNHEGYHGTREQALAYWRAQNIKDNFYVLENDTVVIHGVRFIGTTLFTPMDEPLDQLICSKFPDIEYIDGWKFSDWRKTYAEAVRYIETELNFPFDGETVVVTHHAPSEKSIAPQYQNDTFNRCYYSNLDRLMWYFKIKYWIHGHMHTSFDYVIGDDFYSTRVICNPYGYGMENSMYYNPAMVLDI